MLRRSQMRLSKGHTRIMLLALIFQLLSIVVWSQQSSQTINKASWLNFDKNNKQFTLSNPNNKVQIYFPASQNQMDLKSFQITKGGYWKSVYESELNKDQINIIGNRQQALIQIVRSQNQNIQFWFQKYSDEQQQNIYISSQGIYAAKFKSFKLLCDQRKRMINCKFQSPHKIYILYSPQKGLQNLQHLKNVQQSSTTDNQQMLSFLNQLNVPQDQNNTLNFAKSMITRTLSTICVQKSQYEGYQFFGLCSNSWIDRHYSLLVIDILFKYNSELATWLLENFLDLLQERLFYSFSEREWISIPQHIETFLSYLNVIGEQTGQSVRNKINKVISIQNGLINNLLLSQVNHLSQQINYRQNNKVHPTILKMLNQAWKTDFPRARISSIYAESFTGDFFYHQQNQKLDGSVGKTMWLIKLINQHVKVISKYGDSYQKQSLEQLFSLSKVIQGFVLDDPKAQQGTFNSIIITQKIRVYTRSIGYQSLLPFVYDISPVFPVKTLLNLTSQTGLTSIPIAHDKVSQTYNFRGNVNLYFNYKILFNMIQRFQENQKYTVFSGGVKSIIGTIQKKIMSTFNQTLNNQNSKFFTSWTPEGKGVTSENNLALINLAFLKNLAPQNAKVNGKTGQNRKSNQRAQSAK